MDHFPPRPQQPLRSATSSSSALSRISTVSDFTDFDSLRGHATCPPLQPPPHPRQPLSSLQTSNIVGSRWVGEQGYVYASPTSGWATLTTSPQAVGYSPVASTDAAAQSIEHHGRSYPYNHHEAIPEEKEEQKKKKKKRDGAGLGRLARSAAPMNCGEADNAASTRVSSAPVLDLTTTLGPTTKADEAFIKALQEQEAHGKLTGGLGAGIKADMTVTESALLAATPLSERPLGQTFTRSSRRLSRAETVKRLGQSEANKRGEVIEVVMDDDDDVPPHSKVDISLVAGDDDTEDRGPAPFVPRQTTFPTRNPTTTVFYPQPNWKPFSLRGPYLISLIVLSLALGACVEILYRSSARDPLVSFKGPSEIPPAQYFAIKFLPMIVAVSYGVLWQITNFDVMRLEPFYQMSKEGGALAAESINVDYLGQFNLFRPLRAIHYRHWAVAVSSVASLLANTLVPTLGAASIILSPDRDTRLLFPNREKNILMHHVWSRLLVVTFVIIASLGAVLLYQLQTRRSGLLADVKGIAGLASMATVSHILMDFKDMDVATHQDIHQKLKNHRYVLRNSSLAPDDSSSDQVDNNVNAKTKAAVGGGGGGDDDDDDDDETNRYTNDHLSPNPQPLMLRPAGALPFLCLILLFTVLLPVILFTPATILADRAPWLVTAVAVLIKLSWGALETDVRVMEPYYILSRRHAPPKTLCLDYTAMPFGWVAVQGLLNRHWIVFAVGLGTVAAEVLTVLVTSLATVDGRVFIALLDEKKTGAGGAGGLGGGEDAGLTTRAAAAAVVAEAAASSSSRNTTAGAIINAGEETVPSFWLSLALALAILIYMAAAVAVVFARRGRVFLPRQPNTIASVLAYIHQSKMLYGFVGTAKLSNAEMLKRLEELGKTYGLGWFHGRDGQTHCGIDEEELLSGYKVGYDYSRATKPWEEAMNWL
ncbi:uncharacterized protein P884DRAFT_273424 [Thermothelomyces heterothallicus CBS 202.75]|uniref:uncharacterized protein n=1 Tax=Thermothelomyces heterothallicus CBS 202.75 TaxID=1149848 RepID=UPI003742E642